jgi:hypothetical protein
MVSGIERNLIQKGPGIAWAFLRLKALVSGNTSFRESWWKPV